MEYTVIYEDVPTKVILGKRKKVTYYVSFNSIYASPHHTVRTSIMDALKLYFLTQITKVPVFSGQIGISYLYKSKRKTFDLANKIALLDKCYCDMLQSHNKIANDNVQFIPQLNLKYEYRDNKEDQLTITIKSI